jgi:CubicO group peptidase (beta-lactamase class C family)
MKTRKSKIYRLLRSIVMIVLIAFILSLVVAAAAFSPELVLRAIAWGEADVYDYLKFPSHPIERAEKPYSFTESYDEEKIKSLFENDPLIGDLEDFLERTQTQAFIVIQDDTLLYEGYFNGTQRGSIVTSFSVAKSFDSAMIGIAIDEGYIHSVNDPITDYISELLDRDPRFAEISIRDLLLMSSGLRYAEIVPYGDDLRTYIHPDLRSQALNMTEIVSPPGETFLYNNYNPLLLGLILERSTGMHVADYLQECIWKQLGMEFDATWSLDSKRHSFPKMESGINARAIDFAKFGRLYLNQGQWEGTQIVPEAWVRESISPEPSVRNPDYYVDELGQHIYQVAQGGFYKYMWYGLLRDGVPNDFFATGAKGQYIFLSPSTDLIIVRFGEDYGIESFDWIEIFFRFATAIGES